MKLIDNLFSSLYLFFDAIDDGRPGNKGASLIGAIFVSTMLLAANVLSFFPARELQERWGLYSNLQHALPLADVSPRREISLSIPDSCPG